MLQFTALRCRRMCIVSGGFGDIMCAGAYKSTCTLLVDAALDADRQQHNLDNQQYEKSTAMMLARKRHAVSLRKSFKALELSWIVSVCGSLTLANFQFVSTRSTIESYGVHSMNFTLWAAGKAYKTSNALFSILGGSSAFSFFQKKDKQIE